MTLITQIFGDFIPTSCLFLIPGRTYVLLFKSVSPEDMGEIKFTADKASSSAKLKVKGKQICNVLKSHNSVLLHGLFNLYATMLRCGCKLIISIHYDKIC